MKKITAILLILVMGLGLFACYDSTILPSSTSLTPTMGLGTTTRPTTTRPTSSETTVTTSTTNTTTNKPGTTNTTTTSANVTQPDNPKNDPILNPDIDELTLFKELFNLENHVSLYLDISNKELKKIHQDY